MDKLIDAITNIISNLFGIRDTNSRAACRAIITILLSVLCFSGCIWLVSYFSDTIGKAMKVGGFDNDLFANRFVFVLGILIFIFSIIGSLYCLYKIILGVGDLCKVNNIDGSNKDNAPTKASANIEDFFTSSINSKDLISELQAFASENPTGKQWGVLYCFLAKEGFLLKDNKSGFATALAESGIPCLGRSQFSESCKNVALGLKEETHDIEDGIRIDDSTDSPLTVEYRIIAKRFKKFKNT